MSNPFLSNNKLLQPRNGSQYAHPQPGQQSTVSGYGQPAEQQFSQVEQSYYGPSAGPAQTGRMTFDDVIMRSLTVIGTVVAIAFATAFLINDYSLLMTVTVVGAIGGLVLGLVNAFKREPSPALIMGYAVLQGAFLGGISMVFEATWPGIVIQAVGATAVTFIVTLLLFRSGKVRATPKFRKVMLVGLVSYGAFALINFGLMIFGATDSAFGLRTGVEIAGIPLGVIVGAFAVILAVMTLVVDFDNITQGVRNGIPAKYAWTMAFGIAVSLIWLYLEFLRLLAILRGSD